VKTRLQTRRSLIFALGVGLIPTIAFTLHDLVFQLPDNQHEPSLGFLLTVFGLLLVWGVAGYLAAHGSRTVLTAIGAGAVAAVTSVAILWLTFITLNNLFTDRMSYEPDRIRAFRASGEPTMRAYLHHQPGAGPFPLVMGVAVLAGVAGGAIGRKRQRNAV
jgi:MFS family permease